MKNSGDNFVIDLADKQDLLDKMNEIFGYCLTLKEAEIIMNNYINGNINESVSRLKEALRS